MVFPGKRDMERKAAIITGATGFVGSHLARRLLDDGWDIHLIVRPQSSLVLFQDQLDRVTVYRHDGSTDGMLEIVRSAKPAIVFHLASLFLAQHEAEDVEPMLRSDVIFGTQLVEAMVANGVYQLINTGTSWQHFENESYSPVCLYAATKQAFECILTFYAQTTPLRVITLKLFDTYGPNDSRLKLFTLLRKAAREQTRLAMSPGEQLIDLVYIDDVVDAYLLAAQRLHEQGVDQQEDYAVSSGNPIKLRELVEIYCRVTGTRLLIEWGGRPYRSREVMVPWSTGRVLPGWLPKVGIEEGIRRMEGISR